MIDKSLLDAVVAQRRFRELTSPHVLLYVVHHGDTWFSTEECADEAIEVAELAADQTRGAWTVTVYDQTADRMLDTIYAVQVTGP